MSAVTKIQWAERTWSPVVGCSKVSPGCTNCYAIPVAHKLGRNPNEKIQAAYAGLTELDSHGRSQWSGVVRTLPERLAEPLKWRKPARVFVNSMSDLFHEDVPFEFIAAVFGVMAACPQHTFQILTKRPERMLEWFDWLTAAWPGGPEEALHMCGHPANGGPVEFFWTDAGPWEWPLPNVWLGVSCEDQARADERIPLLLQCPAALHWVSAEPLLGALHLSPWLGTEYSSEYEPCVPGLGWIVVGGESGPGARPCEVEWIESVVEQCREAGVPVFVKQLGSNPFVPFNRLYGVPGGALSLRPLKDPKGGDPAEWPHHLQVREYPPCPR